MNLSSGHNYNKSARRRFLKQMGLGAAAISAPFSLSTTISATRESDFRKFNIDIEPDESYWEMVKKQFTVSPGLIMTNSANLCPCPYFVNEKVLFYSSELAKDVSFQYRSHFAEKRKLAIQKVAEFVGVKESEIGITRNTSESNNIVVNGLDFEHGDEVIVWDQNHPTNLIAWQHRALREGFTVKVIKVPAQPESDDDLLRPFVEAVTENTRLIAFSHLSNVSGIAMPADKLCAYANDRNILTLVDGAQTLGYLDLDLKAMGCSFYSSSSHKWLMGPMENGILYVNQSNEVKLWPNIISAGWKADALSTDTLLCALGQRNNPSTAALPVILDFHLTIGKKAIENRVRQLNTHLKKELLAVIPDIQFITPISEKLSGGVTIFKLPGKNPRDLFQRLYDDHGIASAPMDGVRISPHINSTLKDMDKVVEAVASL